jgi:tetratricopeptide (TPR) repeat protein
MTLKELKRQQASSPDAAIAIGDFHLERKQVDQALAEYRSGLSVTPGNLEIRKRIEELYLSTNQTSRAAEMDQALRQDAPKDVLVRVDHGRVLIAQGNSAEAITYLQNVVADAPDSAQAHYYLANAYWQDGSLPKAQGELLVALKSSVDSPVVLPALARLSLEQGDSAAAKTYASELVQKHPADPGNRELLAEALARQGQYGRAEEQLLAAKRLVPNDPSVHLRLAHIYEAKKETPKAQKEFDVALQLDPHNSLYLGQLSDFLTRQNRLAEALARVQEFVLANPGDANAHVLLGALEFTGKNLTGAQSELEQAVKMDSGNLQALLRLGKLYETSGRIDLAIEHYKSALALHPKYAPLATMIGNLYLERGDFATARNYYQQTLTADPNFAVAIANVAWLDAQEGKNLDIALGMAQKAKSLSPEMPSITDTLGWVMYKKGSYTSAVPLLEDCVAKAPDSARFRYHLGMTLLATGQKNKAKEQLESALRLNLGGTDAQEARHALTQAN